MSHLKNVVRWIVNILTVFLLLVLVLVIYGKCILMFTDNKYPNYFGYTLFEVASGSMEPTLYIDDVILVHITKDNLKKNDIIAFYNENAIITHRIIFIDGDTLTVKGDNNNTVDVPINKKQVIGKVVKVFPKVGVWKKVITEPKILIALFVTLLLFDFALSYKSSDNKTKKKKDVVNKEISSDAIINEIKKEEKVIDNRPKKKKDVIESEELMELTRKIDVKEITELLEKDDIILTNREKRQINSNNKTDKKKVKKDTSKKKSSEYTMRLDLNEIQKKINSKVK